MDSRQRFFALLEGRPIDRAPLMPITMMFAADQIKANYFQYATDYRVLVEAQIRTAERFDLDFVSCISDPAREAADLGALAGTLTINRRPSSKAKRCWPTRRRLCD